MSSSSLGGVGLRAQRLNNSDFETIMQDPGYKLAEERIQTVQDRIIDNEYNNISNEHLRRDLYKARAALQRKFLQLSRIEIERRLQTNNVQVELVKKTQDLPSKVGVEDHHNSSASEEDSDVEKGVKDVDQGSLHDDHEDEEVDVLADAMDDGDEFDDAYNAGNVGSDIMPDDSVSTATTSSSSSSELHSDRSHCQHGEVPFVLGRNQTGLNRQVKCPLTYMDGCFDNAMNGVYSVDEINALLVRTWKHIPLLALPRSLEPQDLSSGACPVCRFAESNVYKTPFQHIIKCVRDKHMVPKAEEMSKAWAANHIGAEGIECPLAGHKAHVNDDYPRKLSDFTKFLDHQTDEKGPQAKDKGLSTMKSGQAYVCGFSDCLGRFNGLQGHRKHWRKCTIRHVDVRGGTS